MNFEMKASMELVINLTRKIFISERIFCPLFCFLLFFPLFFHGPRFGMPYVKGGDEPHYLVIINSLLNDGDLDVRNNYESALHDSWQAGKKFAGVALDRHIVWNAGGKRVTWPEIYENAGKWQKGSDGYYVPLIKMGAAFNVSGLPEYPSHPAGIAFLLAPFLWPVKGTPYTEPLALLCANLAVIFSAFLFRCILKLYTSDVFTCNLGTFLAFLGTPLWAYGRTLFMEPFLLFFAVAAFYLVLGKKSSFWAGIALGLGALLKPNFLILFLPLALFYVKEKRFKTLVWMTVGPIFSTVIIFYLNFWMFCSPFTPTIPFDFGNPFYGIPGLLFSWNHGIIPFAPMVLLSLAAWKQFIREHNRASWIFIISFSLYFLRYAFYWCWQGGWCYGPRLVAPVLPFLMVPIIYLPEMFRSWSKPLKVLALVLYLLSLSFNLLGAFDGYWDSHPLTLL